MRAKKPGAQKPVDLAKIIEALADFQDDPKVQGHHPDSELKGLFLHVGRRSMVWRYRRQKMANGVRKMKFKSLGSYPEVGVQEARKAAVIFAGSVADGKAAPGKRDAVSFEKAWAHYLEHLLRKANLNRKPPRHHANAVKLGDGLILPQWGKWTLHAMSEAPGSVADWHAKMTRVHGPVSANRAAELVRATYKRWGKRDITLPERLPTGKRDITLPERLPTKAIDWNPEEPSQAALAPEDFKAWRAAWDKLGSEVHKGYFLFCLLAGVRPGEGARIRLQDIDTEARTFSIKDVKTPQGHRDITLPLTKEMAYAVAMAVNAPPTSPTIKMKGVRGMKPGEVREVPRRKRHHEIVDADFVFPGCKQMPSRSGLPGAGNILRHTYKTIHAELGISETLSALLMGHALHGVSPKYVSEIIIVRGPALRAAQEKISAYIFELLGLKLGPVGPSASGCHHDAPLVPDAPTRVEATRKKSNAAVPSRIA